MHPHLLDTLKGCYIGSLGLKMLLSFFTFSDLIFGFHFSLHGISWVYQSLDLSSPYICQGLFFFLAS